MIADDRYRLIAELTIPAAAGLCPHVVEQHFLNYLDYACRRLAPDVARVPDGLFSLAPADISADAPKPPQQRITALGPPLPPQPNPLPMSDMRLVGAAGISEPGDLL